jgi:hypothetical protein
MERSGMRWTPQMAEATKMFSSTAWMRLCSSPRKGIRDSPGVLRESLGELNFDRPVRFEAGYVFRDESAVRVGVAFGKRTDWPVTGYATLKDRFSIVQRYRFRPSVEYVH